MIDKYSQLVTFLYEYLLFSYDRKHNAYLTLLDNFSRRLNMRDPEAALYDFDCFDLIVAKARLEEFDSMYSELMDIIQTNFRISLQLDD